MLTPREPVADYRGPLLYTVEQGAAWRLRIAQESRTAQKLELKLQERASPRTQKPVQAAAKMSYPMPPTAFSVAWAKLKDARAREDAARRHIVTRREWPVHENFIAMSPFANPVSPRAGPIPWRTG